jgi:hypothetical protein
MVRRDPNVVAAEEALQRALGSKVRIVQDRSGSGRIEIRFFSAEELDRLYETFLARERGEATPAQRRPLRKSPTETSAH